MTNYNSKKVISGKNILYFGPGKWDGLWRNRHQLMVRFSRSNKVMYIERSFNLRSVLEDYNPLKKGWSAWLKALARPNVRQPYPNLYVYSPPIYTFIVSRYRLHNLMWWFWRRILKRHMRKLGFSNPIVWFSLPTMVELVDKFDAAATIYHVVDAYTAYGSIDEEEKRMLLSLDNEMTKKADLVFVVSEKLAQHRRVINPNTHIIPNGVDFEKFDKIRRSNQAVPADIRDLPRPIIGYSGLIAGYIELDYFARIAEAYPGASVVIVGDRGSGPHVDAFDRLIQKENIHYLGRKAIENLPMYLKAFDVCMVPYRETKQVIYSSSLKMYDYLAFGKPIVATSFPTSRELEGYLYIGSTAEDFLKGIESAIHEDDEEIVEKRRRFAASNTWDHRVSAASELIEAKLSA